MRLHTRVGKNTGRTSILTYVRAPFALNQAPTRRFADTPKRSPKALGLRLHGADKIRWINDRLPGLENVRGLGISFEFILMNAFWMHVPPPNRRRAFRKLVTLLKPGAWMAISFRQPDPGGPRSMFPCHVDELEQLAIIHGSFIERVERANDELARSGIEWTRVIIRLPDDGTGALPVIRHIILKDSKSSTYKLALLRVLARIAECSLGLTRPVNEEYVAVPLGLIAVFWSDPERDVRVARELALDLLKRDRLFCVWTGKKLKEDSLDIDHCFPWSAWPCGDLRNLLPAL